jgi:hypothetical protein
MKRLDFVTDLTHTFVLSYLIISSVEIKLPFFPIYQKVFIMISIRSILVIAFAIMSAVTSNVSVSMEWNKTCQNFTHPNILLNTCWLFFPYLKILQL